MRVYGERRVRRTRVAVVGVTTKVGAKAKGTRNEHRSRRLLESQGYRVTRAAGSMGEWDLIGMHASGLVLVQVKTDRLPSPAERQGMETFPAPTVAQKLIHVWKPMARAPRVLVWSGGEWREPR